MNRGKLFTLIVVSEGAKAVNGSISLKKTVKLSPYSIRHCGARERMASELEYLLPGKDIHCTVLGHLQREVIHHPVIEFFRQDLSDYVQ